MELVRLSKRVAHALRHEPWRYELEPDDEGWVPVPDLLDALRGSRAEWGRLGADDLAAMVARSDKRRYELRGGRIRALYGHSLPGKLLKERAEPPPILFHGTSRGALDAIRAEGLRPMRRQYVHLSPDEATARQVATRRAGPHLILPVRAVDADRAGVPFYRGNEFVWLADRVPAAFIDGLAEP